MELLTRTYTYPPPTDPRSYAGLTGLEVLRRIAAGELPAAPMAVTMAMSLVEVEHGRAVFEGDPGAWAYNPIGAVHGGFSATLLDSALGCAIHSTLPADTLYTTLSLEVKLLRAITATTGRVRAVGKIVHVGRQTGTAEATLTTVEGGKLLATATTTCLVMQVSAG